MAMQVKKKIKEILPLNFAIVFDVFLDRKDALRIVFCNLSIAERI